jgi:nucleoside-diphosphate-sugar epimerase
MRVLVVGATGVIGRAAIPRLIEAGHQVIGLARTPEKLLLVDRMGADAARGDILDAAIVRRVLLDRSPDIVVNLATAIPMSLKIDPKEWELNNRIRTTGTLNLLRACEAAGVSLLVQESVGYVCESRGTDWITETSARSAHPFLTATVEMEDIVRAGPVPSTLLRFGALLSADSWHTQQSVAALRRGMLPIIGQGEGYLSLIHAGDAAQAIVCAVQRREAAAGETYNVTDDAPATMAEVFPFAAGALNAPMPKSVPPFLARMVVGSLTLDILTASYRMSNAKIRAELGFSPQFPTFQEIWKEIATALSLRDVVAYPQLQ